MFCIYETWLQRIESDWNREYWELTFQIYNPWKKKNPLVDFWLSGLLMLHLEVGTKIFPCLNLILKVHLLLKRILFLVKLCVKFIGILILWLGVPELRQRMSNRLKGWYFQIINEITTWEILNSDYCKMKKILTRSENFCVKNTSSKKKE